MQEGMRLEYENFKEALNAPKKEPRQFNNNSNRRGGGDFNTEGEGYRGGFNRGGRGGRGRRGGHNQHHGGGHVKENDSAFDRSSKPAASTTDPPKKPAE